MSSSPYTPRRRIQASVRQVQEAVADYYGFSLGELLSRSRARQLTAPRHLAMYLAKEITDASLPVLGEAFRRDHTTVLYGLRKISADLTRDPCAVAAVDVLRQRLEAGQRPIEEIPPLRPLHPIQASSG